MQTAGYFLMLFGHVGKLDKYVENPSKMSHYLNQVH